MRGWVCVSLVAAATTGAMTVQAQEPVSPAGALDSLLDLRISSAAKYEQTLREVAGSVTIVTADEIARFGYRTLAEALGSVRGFYLSNDRNYTYLGVRGFSRPTDYNNRVLLLIDGYRANEGLWGAAYFGGELDVDLASLERIEVIRGPGSALYGTGAMFAIVNLVTKTGAAESGVRVTARGGSLGSRGGDVLAGRRFADGTDLSVSATFDRSTGEDLYFPEFDTPATDGGMARGSDGETRVGVAAIVTRRGAFLRARASSRRKHVPTAPYETLFNDSRSATRDQFAYLQLGYEGELRGDLHLAAASHVGAYRYDGDWAYESVWQERAEDLVAGGEATLRWDVSSAHRVTIGGDVQRHLRALYFYPRTGPRQFAVGGPFTMASGYLQDELQLDPRLSLLAGVRYDWSTVSADGALAPRAAAILRPAPGTTLKVLYGQAFREPTVTERSWGRDLAPERVATTEIIAQQRIGPAVLATVSAFHTGVSNLIDAVPDADSSVFANRGSVHAHGLELGLDARFSRVTATLGYTYDHAVDAATDERLTNSPAHVIKLGLGAEVGRGLEPAIEARHEAGRRTVQDTWTDPSTVVDLTVGYLPRASRSGLGRLLDRTRLTLSVRNLFDADYATPAGFEHLQPAIQQDGRLVRAELRLSF